MATEAQTGGRHPQPRDAGQLQELRRGKAQILPWRLQQGLVLPTPHFWPSDTDFGTPELLKNKCLLFEEKKKSLMNP